MLVLVATSETQGARSNDFMHAIEGELVTRFEYAKVRALLAYLAVEGDRPHRREADAAIAEHRGGHAMP